MLRHLPALRQSRRNFLTAAGAAAASGLGLGTLAHLSAVAQSGPDYKALVCLFMFGGNDGNNLLVPLDGASHAQYERIRPNLALARDALLPIAPSNTGGRPFGLHPAMGGLQRLFTQGRAAMLANVGPLLVPTTKAELAARRIAVPDNLYSHSDQQAQWQSGAVDGAARSGWGGRLMERLLASDARNRGYGLLSMAGGNLWENGDLSLQPYKVSPSGRFGFDFYEAGSTEPLSVAIAQTLAEPRDHLLEQAWNEVVGRSIENQRVLTRALEGGALATGFPGTGLGRQLQMVARLISARTNLGLARSASSARSAASTPTAMTSCNARTSCSPRSARPWRPSTRPRSSSAWPIRSRCSRPRTSAARWPPTALAPTTAGATTTSSSAGP